MCLWILKIQILITLRLRFELVNDRNDRTGTDLFPWNFLKSENWKVKHWHFIKNQKSNWSQIWARRRPRITIRKHRDRQERLRNERSLHESQAFSTCPPSGNQVDGLPLAPRNKAAAAASWIFSGRACIHKTRRDFFKFWWSLWCKCACEYWKSRFSSHWGFDLS